MCQREKPIVDELQQEYSGKIEFIKLDITKPENAEKLNNLGFSHIPAMVYVSANGKCIDATDEFQEKEQLKSRLDNLLKQ